MSSLINGGGHAEAVHKTGRKFVNGNVSNQRSAQSTQSSHLAGISNRASSTKLHHPPGGANKNNMHSLIFGGN